MPPSGHAPGCPSPASAHPSSPSFISSSVSMRPSPAGSESDDRRAGQGELLVLDAVEGPCSILAHVLLEPEPESQTQVRVVGDAA